MKVHALEISIIPKVGGSKVFWGLVEHERTDPPEIKMYGKDTGNGVLLDHGEARPCDASLKAAIQLLTGRELVPEVQMTMENSK